MCFKKISLEFKEYKCVSRKCHQLRALCIILPIRFHPSLITVFVSHLFRREGGSLNLIDITCACTCTCTCTCTCACTCTCLFNAMTKVVPRISSSLGSRLKSSELVMFLCVLPFVPVGVDWNNGTDILSEQMNFMLAHTLS